MSRERLRKTSRGKCEILRRYLLGTQNCVNHLESEDRDCVMMDWMSVYGRSVGSLSFGRNVIAELLHLFFYVAKESIAISPPSNHGCVYGSIFQVHTHCCSTTNEVWAMSVILKPRCLRQWVILLLEESSEYGRWIYVVSFFWRRWINKHVMNRLLWDGIVYNELELHMT